MRFHVPTRILAKIRGYSVAAYAIIRGYTVAAYISFATPIYAATVQPRMEAYACLYAATL